MKKLKYLIYINMRLNIKKKKSDIFIDNNIF